jgi:hypothetical protein
MIFVVCFTEVIYSAYFSPTFNTKETETKECSDLHKNTSNICKGMNRKDKRGRYNFLVVMNEKYSSSKFQVR